MSEYSTLRCDGGCGTVITEEGYARVELPEGWSRSPYSPDDYCPNCTAQNEPDARQSAAEGAGAPPICPACSDGHANTENHACELGENGGWGSMSNQTEPNRPRLAKRCRNCGAPHLCACPPGRCLCPFCKSANMETL